MLALSHGILHIGGALTFVYLCWSLSRGILRSNRNALCFTNAEKRTDWDESTTTAIDHFPPLHLPQLSRDIMVDIRHRNERIWVNVERRKGRM